MTFLRVTQEAVPCPFTPTSIVNLAPKWNHPVRPTRVAPLRTIGSVTSKSFFPHRNAHTHTIGAHPVTTSTKHYLVLYSEGRPLWGFWQQFEIGLQGFSLFTALSGDWPPAKKSCRLCLLKNTEHNRRWQRRVSRVINKQRYRMGDGSKSRENKQHAGPSGMRCQFS